MNTFAKNCGICLGTVLISELLCLILAFSFAIMQGTVMRWLSLLCGMLAHILLMYSAAQKAASADAVLFRRGQTRIGILPPLLTACTGMLPFLLDYLLLCMQPESILILNLFPLLQSPFLQLHRLLIGGAEPFSAVPAAHRIWMAFPPLITGAAWFIGYRIRYTADTVRTEAERHLPSSPLA